MNDEHVLSKKLALENENPVQSPTPILLFSFKVLIIQRLLPELASLPPCPAGSGITSPSPLSDSKPSTCFPRIPAYGTRTPFELPVTAKFNAQSCNTCPTVLFTSPNPYASLIGPAASAPPTRRPKRLAWVACIAHT